MSKPMTKKMTEKPRILNDNQPQNMELIHKKSAPGVPQSAQNLAIATNERDVEPLNAEFTDLLAAPQSQFHFKSQFLPVAAILVFSLVLVLFYHYGKTTQNTPRGVAGNLNDLSNGQFLKQAADYSEEKVCTELSDGTKSCTTKTKLRREFR